MTDETATARSRSGHWDTLRLALQEQRARVGNPSYAEIASRIAAARERRGVDEHAARVPRSTVYDAFRPGRARINLPLVREIAEALGADDATVDAWVSACHENAADPHEVDTSPVPAAPAPAQPDAAVPGRPRTRDLVLLAVGCIAVNLLGRVVVDVLHLPFYLDMVGTAVAAIVLGPWRGAGVGAATNLLAVVSSGPVSLAFAVVNVAGALVWGYGVRAGWGRTLPRFFVLTLGAALACSVVAVPILVLGFGGSVGQGQDTITRTLVDLGTGLVPAVAASNLITSTMDKLVSGFAALVMVAALPVSLRAGSRLLPSALGG